jgi:O-methyltransferase
MKQERISNVQLLMIKSAIHKSFRALGLEVRRHRAEGDNYPPDFSASEIEIIRSVRSWTMTSPERIYALIHAVRYITANAVEGAIVECGVWKGGSMAAVARTLLQLQDVSRPLYLFDTFEGMSKPTARDVDFEGNEAGAVMEQDEGYKCANAPLDAVKKVLQETKYPADRIHYIPGKVEDTIPAAAPTSISLLRMDTDWYESTKHELVHLFPRLSRNGVIIIDDYGHWKGSRQACDEYFAENRISVLLNRIDYTGRMAVKS